MGKVKKERKAQSAEEIETRMLNGDGVCKLCQMQRYKVLLKVMRRGRKQQGLYSTSDEAQCDSRQAASLPQILPC